MVMKLKYVSWTSIQSCGSAPPAAGARAKLSGATGAMA
jgi:hypothetical protein